LNKFAPINIFKFEPIPEVYEQNLGICDSQRNCRNMTTKCKLNTGAEIPAIGFGTWQDEGEQENAVAEAIKAGYRHVDTARV